MKKLLALVLVAAALVCHAELPKNLNVYTAHIANVPICKILFSEYDKVYNTQSQIIVKPGATGIIAMKAMQSEPDLSVLCASGVSDHVVNKITYPEHKDALDDLKIVSVLATSGIVFVTSKTNTFNTLPEMLKQNKEITVGFHSLGLKTAGHSILKNSKILWVPHKSSLEAVAALSDGSLDLYVDGSGLIPLLKTGKLKSLGYINHINAEDNLLGVDLSTVYKSQSKVKLIIGVSTSLKNSRSDILELESRIKHIQSSSVVQDTIHSSNYKAYYMSSIDSEEAIRLFENAYFNK